MKDEGDPLWLSFKRCTQVINTTCLFEIFIIHYFHTVLLEKGISDKGILKA